MIEKINTKINRSKINYALSLAKSLSKKDSPSLDKIWALSGFKSRKILTVHSKKFTERVS